MGVINRLGSDRDGEWLVLDGARGDVERGLEDDSRK